MIITTTYARATQHACPRFVLCVMLSGLLAGPARAQEAPVPQQAADSEAGFMTGYRFHLAAARLLIDDELFSWDADFGGDVDLWTFRQGRINFLANYKAVLG